jgi:hypothetical protein
MIVELVNKCIRGVVILINMVFDQLLCNQERFCINYVTQISEVCSSKLGGAVSKI